MVAYTVKRACQRGLKFYNSICTVVTAAYLFYCPDWYHTTAFSALEPRKEGNMLIDMKQMNCILEMVAASRKLIENTVWLVSSHLSSGNYKVL